MLQLGVIELVETGLAVAPGRVEVIVTCTMCGVSTTTDVRADLADLRYVANAAAEHLCKGADMGSTASYKPIEQL